MVLKRVVILFSVDKKIQRMDEIIAKAKSCAVDCHNIDKKLRQLVDLTEDEAHFHMKQSAFLYHLGVQTMHKSLHCLSMRLTVEYFKSSSVDMELPDADKLENPNFHHYVLFSLNVLAASVTINSTVMNSEVWDSRIFISSEATYISLLSLTTFFCSISGI